MSGVFFGLFCEWPDPQKSPVAFNLVQVPISFSMSLPQAQLHAIQIDPGTYLTGPSGPKEAFDDWLSTFTLDSKKGDISELLVANVEVRSLYTQLVSVNFSDLSSCKKIDPIAFCS